MLSCSVTLICVTVTAACVASVSRVSPRTLALDRKLESTSALSPGARGGISGGAAAGSNVRLVKATGCWLIIGAEVSLGCRRDERPRHANEPRISIPNNAHSTNRPREDNAASSFHLPSKTAAELRICGWRMTRKVLSSGQTNQPLMNELNGHLASAIYPCSHGAVQEWVWRSIGLK